MSHSRSSTLTPVARMTGSYAKGVGTNVLRTFNDNKMQSLPFVAAVGIAIACQFIHLVATHPERWAMWFVLPAGFCVYVIAMNLDDPRFIKENLGQYARLTATFLWLGLAIWRGILPELVMFGACILGAWYFSFFKMLVTVENMPKTVLQLPEKAPDPEPEVPYKGIPWLEGAQVSAPRTIPTGTEQTIVLPKKSNPKDFVRTRTNDMANVEEIPATKMELLDPNTGFTVTMRKHTSLDILAEPRAWPWASKTVTDTREPMPIGFNRSGETRRLPLRQGHILIGGATGSGKSVTFAQITAAIALDPNADSFGIDPKRADLRAFRHSMRSYVQDDYDKALEVLRYVAGSIPKRMELTDEHEVENVADLPWVDGHQMVPTYFLLIDELAHLTVDAPKDIREEALRLIGIVLKQGRAADVWLVAATQRPSTDTIPGDLRDQFRYAFCLRVRTTVTTAMVLGDKPGVDASEIPSDRPGVGYFQNDEGIELIRSGYLPPDEKLRLAKLAPPAIGQVREVPALASVHQLLPPQEGGVETLPNGDPLPPGWQGELWRTLEGDGDWHSVSELAARVGKTNNPVRNLLREWTSKRLLAESVEGQTTKWKRAA